ncbi:MAG: zinc ribbon domain-containing protein [Candidatus Omnitrophota bacterium]|nr:MAG: zinc ribbon domain-containing protein [Candidatus Omnitrophota bacterium]
MPIFTYQCQKCKHKFDLLVGITMDKAKFECPKCQSKKVTKLITSSINVGKSSSNGSCSTGSCPTCCG